MNTRGRDAVIAGAGAGLMLIVLLVVQSFIGGGLLSMRTVTSTTTVLTTTTQTSTSRMAPSSIQLHEVTFNESAGCDGAYANKWSVTLGNITIKQPSNMTESLLESGDEIFGPEYVMISTIVFTVPDGIYNFTTYAPAMMFPYSGTVNVSGSDVIVQLEAEPSCIT
jgi:hypothetical protein